MDTDQISILGEVITWAVQSVPDNDKIKDSRTLQIRDKMKISGKNEIKFSTILEILC